MALSAQKHLRHIKSLSVVSTVGGQDQLSGVAEGSPPVAVSSVLVTVLFSLIDNPVNALLTGNFLGCL